MTKKKIRKTPAKTRRKPQRQPKTKMGKRRQPKMERMRKMLESPTARRKVTRQRGKTKQIKPKMTRMRDLKGLIKWRSLSRRRLSLWTARKETRKVEVLLEVKTELGSLDVAEAGVAVIVTPVAAVGAEVKAGSVQSVAGVVAAIIVQVVATVAQATGKHSHGAGVEAAIQAIVGHAAGGSACEKMKEWLHHLL